MGIKVPEFDIENTEGDAPSVSISNLDKSKIVDIELVNGKNRMAVDAVTVVEQVFGQDPQATTWLYIGTQGDFIGVGSAGDTVRIQIPAFGIWPAVDVTTIVTAGIVASSNPEQALADLIVSNLNSDSNFLQSWKAARIKDFSGVFINSKLFNEFGTRSSWTVDVTGTTVVTKAFDDIKRRGFPTELQRSPNDPRQGILAISGSISLNPTSTVDVFTEKFLTTGLSEDMTVNGSATPVEFFINAHPTKRKVVQLITFSGVTTGVKYGQFLGLNSKLTNGIVVDYKTQDETASFDEVINSTDDFEDDWALVPSDFRLTIASGGDHFNSTKDLRNNVIVLEPQGSFSTDDFIRITINDNLSSISEMNARAKGFLIDV